MQTNCLWNPLLGKLVLNQNFTKRQMVVLLVSFIGIILVVDPNLLGLPDNVSFGSNITPNEENSENYFNLYFGTFLGLLSGFFISVKIVYTTEGANSINLLHNLYYMSVGGALFSSIVNVAQGKNNQIGWEDVPRVGMILAFGL